MSNTEFPFIIYTNIYIYGSEGGKEDKALFDLKIQYSGNLFYERNDYRRRQ